MSVVKFNRNFSALFNWDSDESPTTEQAYQGAVKNWTETEMNIVDTILWQPETDYVENNIVKTPSLPLHYVLVCATGGTSGTEEPSYDNVQIGDNVTDGTVTWTVAKLAVGDIPVVSDRAKVDASNIGVNADTDNSEAWGSAIGGGAVAEDDGRLVTGDTVYAVTSELASDIADNTANISQNATDIDIADKRISNIEKLLQGNLYDYQSDTDSAYTKTVLAGAMPYASLDSVGGKTVVWNQLVDSGTSTVTLTSGHKYYTLISGTASIVTGDGSVVSVTGGTDMVCDLTLMFGSGNEPATTTEFGAIFPNAITTYNAGTLLSAGVTEVVSQGRNLLNPADIVRGTINSSDGSNANSTTRLRTPMIEVEPSTTYTLSCSNALVYEIFEFNANQVKIAQTSRSVASYNLTTNANTKYIKFTFCKSDNSTFLVSELQNPFVAKGTSVAYVPYVEHTYPIPASIQSLEGYGWSAGSVYNYIDYERKVFVQRVGSVDLGTLTWTYQSAAGAFYTTEINNIITPATGNLICPNYVFGSIVASVGQIASLPDKQVYRQPGNKNVFIKDSAYTDATAFKTAVNGVTLYYELATPIETDISEYLTDDNLISVESGGTLSFPNSNGDDYRIDVPSSETFMVDLQSALGE